MKPNALLLGTIVLAALWGCEQRRSSAGTAPATSRPAASRPAATGPAAFSAEQARIALIAYVREYPDAFVSPGHTESAEALAAARLEERDGKAFLGDTVVIDLPARSYRVVHRYGHGRPGRFEDWEWDGRLEPDRRGGWQATAPEHRQVWGTIESITTHAEPATSAPRATP